MHSDTDLPFNHVLITDNYHILRRNVDKFKSGPNSKWKTVDRDINIPIVLLSYYSYCCHINDMPTEQQLEYNKNTISTAALNLKLRGMHLDPPQPSFPQELDVLRKIASAASDVSLAYRNKEFAELAGIDALNDILFDLVYNYERTLSDMDV